MAFTVNGPKWKQVRLEGKPGYWIQVDDNDSPIDLDEQGNIRVYSSKQTKIHNLVELDRQVESRENKMIKLQQIELEEKLINEQ